MLKHKLDIIIILINNDGYTIERWVHGMRAAYNDIPMWRYADLPRVMGGDPSDHTTYTINTVEELESMWASNALKQPKGMHFVEMRMPKEDAPLSLKMVCGSAARRNAT
jgi:pyruvate decarboxylase